MPADGGHLGPRSGSLNTILAVDHRWHVCYIGLLVSEEKILKHFFPIGCYVKTVCWRWPSWMEVRFTRHYFENWLPKDHPCHVCFKLAYWFQRKKNLNIFPIGSYVNNYVCWWWPSWMEVWVTGYNFESWPPKDHSYHVCSKLTNWFQRRRLLNIFFHRVQC